MDDPRILPLIASIGAAFAFLFSSWSNKQDNDEFFNGYQDSERKVCRGWEGKGVVGWGLGARVELAQS